MHNRIHYHFSIFFKALANGFPTAKFPWLKPLVTPLTSTSRSRIGQDLRLICAQVL